MKINLKRTLYVGCGAEPKYLLILKNQKGRIRGYEELEYLGVKIDKEGRQENDINNRNNKGRAVTGMLNGGTAEQINN